MDLNAQGGCNFCDEVLRTGSDASLAFHNDEHCVALPTLGCFVPGYSLLTPRRHVLSFANLSPDEFASSAITLERLRTSTGSGVLDPIIAEHGTGEDGLTAACCAHAHLHIIPVGEKRDAILHHFIEAGGAPHRCHRINGIVQFAGTSYMMLSLNPGEFLVWQDMRRFHRQFIRFAAARALGLEKYYDWRKHPFPENMAFTRTLMRRELQHR